MSDQKFTKLTLETPVTINGQEVSEISLRRPSPGELRGVRLIQLMAMDVDAVMQVVPRISEPAVDSGTLAGMDLFDFGEIAGAVVGFFQKPAPKAPATTGPDGPTT